MKNLFTVNFAEATIYATKTTLKKASIPNSAEYKTLMNLMKQNPRFTIAVKETKERQGRKTYAGLNKNFIAKYISIQSNAEELTAKMDLAFQMGKFPMVRSWFLHEFENFDMDAAKEAIMNAALEEINAATNKQQNDQKNTLSPAANISAMPNVVNK